MNILVIANPDAGTGRTLHAVRVLCGILERNGHHVTTRTGRELAGDIVNDLDRLVIAGGDGTVNDVLNRLSDPTRVPIVHLGTGTANMLARDLGLPRAPEELAQVMEHGKIRRIDVGLIGSRRFLLLASAGFDATVVQEVEKYRATTMGYHRYAIPILRALARWRPADLHIRVDGRKDLWGKSVLMLKTKHYGGFRLFGGDAALNSGTFSVFVFHGGTIPALFRYSLAAMMGTVSRLRDVTHLAATSITIESSQPVPIQVDGDSLGVTPITVDLCPSLVPMVVPATREASET